MSNKTKSGLTKWLWREECGSTLIELLIAMALFAGVVLPAATFLGYMAHNSINKDKMLALAEAQALIEQMIDKGSYENGLAEKEWRHGGRIEREIRITESGVLLKVRVYRRGREIMNLSTVRLTDSFKNEKIK